MTTKNKKGLVHLYFGGGKGKTTASIGLAVRMMGSGGKVIFAQFLKSGKSSEIALLEKLGALTFHTDQSGKFTWKMTPEETEICRQSCRALFQTCLDAVRKETADLVVLDEVLDCAAKGFLSWEDLEELAQLPSAAERVMTGREPSARLLDLADYASSITAKKHPYQQGIAARKGIEY